jgi:hypothetical protein
MGLIGSVAFCASISKGGKVTRAAIFSGLLDPDKDAALRTREWPRLGIAHLESSSGGIVEDVRGLDHPMMPTLLESGPERMVKPAKTKDLLVPIDGYKVHVYGASPMHLTPQQWRNRREF